ncbi:lytic transglycosylase domain-containing protein, partial [Candidatus Woesearchaeota archaeon]|nr:lytic transglycosylase domain-containing protein [Candidatus Woesearchaeota archaeon]
QILKNLNKKFRVTEEGIKYLSKGKEQLEKRKRYLDDITKLEVTRDLEARGTILEEYYSDTTKNKEIYDWIETRTLRNLGYNNIQIKNIKNNGFESKEISERIKQKISFMIELTEFYKLINQENEDPLFIKAVIMQESKFDNNAKSHAGAEGFMQLMPETAKQYNVNKNNPIQNIVGGTRMLSKLKYKYSEYTPTTQKIFTLIGYNWGPRNVSRFMKYGLECLPKETAKYVPYVLGYEAELNKIYTL